MKKSLLWLIVLLLLLLLCVSMVVTSEAAPKSKFSGVKLSVYLVGGPHGEAFEKIGNEWASANDVKISWTTLPGWVETISKIVLELESGLGMTDLMQVSNVWMPQIGPRLEPLGKYMEAYNVDISNFIPEVAVNAATIDGELRGFPLAPESFPYAYRKDLFEKYGVDKVPETLDEMLEAARKINHPEDEIYGFGGMAKRGVYPYWHYITFLRAMGGDIFDEDGKPALDTDVALEAMEYLQELYKYTNPACLAWDHFDAYESFYKTGGSAQLILWDGGFKVWLFNEEFSDYAAVSDASRCPGVKVDGGEIRYGQPIAIWYMTINSYSKNKDAAMDLLHYVTYEKAIEYTIKSTFITTKMAREDPEVIAMCPIWDAVLESLELASTEPGGEHFMDMANAIGTEISAMLAGLKDPAKALKDANNRLIEIFR